MLIYDNPIIKFLFWTKKQDIWREDITTNDITTNDITTNDKS